MRIEHLIYSAALAVIIGMLYYRSTGRDPSWIIVISAFAPDVDQAFCSMRCWFGVSLAFNGHLIQHGDFHTLGALCVYAVLLGALLVPVGIRFWEGMLFAGIGFAAHLVEDALVYRTSYAILWPFSNQVVALGLMDYSRDFYGIADTQVLVLGLFLLTGAVALRRHVERDWFFWIPPSVQKLWR
jgi:hypothetical protein